MNNSTHTLFALLRSALWFPAGEAVDLSALTKADWEALVDLAFEQGVASIMVDGFGSTGSPTENEGLGTLDSPELEDLKYEWLSPSGFSSLASPSSVATRHNPSKLGFCTRCSIGSHLGN
ncbi:MAG: hypothetical protein KBT00_07080, partial [Bacteroidales bacterium]|nr:hypothetical protein [Candidatus Cacconaster merdequi]